MIEVVQPPEDALRQNTLAAFMGALDDIAAVTVAPKDSFGAEIVGRVFGLFDKASTYYDTDMAQNLELMNSLAGRLGEMACMGHNHLAGMLDMVNDRYGLDQDDEHDGHTHEDDDDEDEEEEKAESRRKKRSQRRRAFVGWRSSRAA